MLLNASDLDTSPVEFLTAGIPRIGHGFLYGPSTAGKSLVALDLALAVANPGAKWCGHEVNYHGTVAYLMGEGVSSMGVRVQARLAREQSDQTAAVAAEQRDHGDQAARAMIAALPRYDSANLKIWPESFPMYFDRSERPTAGMKQAVAQLATLVEGGLELVIVDAIADYTGQLSLSNWSSANRITKGLKYLASELDCFILCVSHTTADKSKMIGSQRLFDSSDAVLEIIPDDVSAPGAMASATVTARKDKSDQLADGWGYVVEPCRWEQPAEDEDGNPVPGELIEVRSATVRRIEQARPSAPAPEPQRQAPPLPELQAVERRTKRNGIRRHGLHAVPDPAPRRDLTAALLSVQCPDCSRLGGGMRCDVKMAGSSGLIPVSFDPLVAVHADRAVAAWMAGHLTEAELNTVLAAVA